MTDKMYFISSSMFSLMDPTMSVWDEEKQTWVLNEERWYNYCMDMANRGVNMFRWLGWSVWPNWSDSNGYKTNLTPFVQVSEGVFDLTKRNNKYWEIAEQMIRIMNYPSQKAGNTAPGISLWIDLFYQYTNDSHDQQFSPWRNNVQGIKNLYDIENRQYALAYMLEWFKLAKEKGLKIVFGMGNEMTAESLDFCYFILETMDQQKIWPHAWAICPDIPSNGNDLFKKLPSYIYDYNLFMWHPLRQDPADRWDTSIIRPTHGCCGCENNQGVNVFEQAMDYWAVHPIRWQVSDDGCMGGATPRPGVDQWTQMVTRICTYHGTEALTKVWNGIEMPIMGIEHLPDDEPWDDCKEEQLKIFEAMAVPYEQYIGPLANKGKWTVPYVKPECQIGEVKTETCYDGSVIITATCENGKWKETGNTCPIPPEQKCSCFYYINWNDKLFGISNFIKCIFGKIDKYCKDK
jgi:hypothetical protein